MLFEYDNTNIRHLIWFEYEITRFVSIMKFYDN